MRLLFWILIAVAAIFVAIIVAIKLWVKLTTGWCRNDVRLIGKTAIITGANTGIGYETAADFAKRGARVILACRNTARGKEAEEKLIKATGNNNVIFKQMDLASFQSIRAFVEDIKKNEERLDILVNNAGGGYQGNKISEDGLLLPMQINYFGHFLLTNLLLDLLKSTPNSRIVNVASIGAKWTTEFDVNKLNDFPEHNSRADLLVYSWSKLCNILFTIELADRLKGTSVTAYSLHPGAVLTDIFKSMPKWTRILWESVTKWFLRILLKELKQQFTVALKRVLRLFLVNISKIVVGWPGILQQKTQSWQRSCGKFQRSLSSLINILK